MTRASLALTSSDCLRLVQDLAHVKDILLTSNGYLNKQVALDLMSMDHRAVHAQKCIQYDNNQYHNNEKYESHYSTTQLRLITPMMCIQITNASAMVAPHIAPVMKSAMSVRALCGSLLRTLQVALALGLLALIRKRLARVALDGLRGSVHGYSLVG